MALDCLDNNLEKLDISNNTNLKELLCSGNYLHDGSRTGYDKGTKLIGYDPEITTSFYFPPQNNEPTFFNRIRNFFHMIWEWFSNIFKR